MHNYHMEICANLTHKPDFDHINKILVMFPYTRQDYLRFNNIKSNKKYISSPWTMNLIKAQKFQNSSNTWPRVDSK